MTLRNLADMLAKILGTEDVFAGNIDGNLSECIGVYNSKRAGKNKICLGGRLCTKTHEKEISILIHHTDNPSLAESRAQKVADVLSAVRDEVTEGGTVRYIMPNAPRDVGRDERGICEYVIEATVYYEESEE